MRERASAALLRHSSHRMRSAEHSASPSPAPRQSETLLPWTLTHSEARRQRTSDSRIPWQAGVGDEEEEAASSLVMSSPKKKCDLGNGLIELVLSKNTSRSLFLSFLPFESPSPRNMMLRQQGTLQTICAVPLIPCRRPARAAAPPARPAMMPTRTVSKPLSMGNDACAKPSKAPSKRSSLAAYASSDTSSEFVEPFSVRVPLSYVHAMGGNVGFRAGEDASTVTPTLLTTATTKKDTDSTRSKITRFAARFVAFTLIMVSN